MEQDSSADGDAGYVCLDVVQMEEEVPIRAQVEVWREEQGIGKTHGESQNEEVTRNKRSTAHHGWHEDDTSARYTDTFSGSSWAMLWACTWSDVQCAWEKSVWNVSVYILFPNIMESVRRANRSLYLSFGGEKQIESSRRWFPPQCHSGELEHLGQVKRIHGGIGNMLVSVQWSECQTDEISNKCWTRLERIATSPSRWRWNPERQNPANKTLTLRSRVVLGQGHPDAELLVASSSSHASLPPPLRCRGGACATTVKHGDRLCSKAKGSPRANNTTGGGGADNM